MKENKFSQKSEIILIGPMGAGKSTLSALIAKKLGKPQCSMDSYRWQYYEEIGYDHEKAQNIRENDGFISLYHYWKPFEIYSMERLLAEHRNCVIDFGAGHTVYEDALFFKRAQHALKPYKNVVLLIPSPDPEESINILNKRRPSKDRVELNAHFVHHHSNYDLAKYVVYTKNKSLKSSRDEVLSLVDR